MNVPLHARLWNDHQHVLLHHLQGMGVHATTIVWLSEQLTAAYWQWAQMLPAPLVKVTTTVPQWPWIAITGKIQVPRGVRGAQVPRATVQGARILLAQHSGYGAGRTPPGREDPPLAPRGPSPYGAARPGNRPPPVMAPNTAPRICFHDLPKLATLRGTIAAVDAWKAPAGMAMARVAHLRAMWA